MNKFVEFEEGSFSVDGKAVEWNEGTSCPCLICIPADKVECFWIEDREEPDDTIVFMTSNHRYEITGYGSSEQGKGLGRLYYELMLCSVGEPIGFKHEHDVDYGKGCHAWEADDEIPVMNSGN